jgi:hypothetical protein
MCTLYATPYWFGTVSKSICFGDCLVLPKLLDENVRFSGVATTENCPSG